MSHMRRFWRREKDLPTSLAAADHTTLLSSTKPRVGLYVFYTCQEATIDIVFLHGLNGHWWDTWKAQEAPMPWPEQWLPSRVKHARIMSYGYDSRVTHWRQIVSQNSVGDHANNLLRDLSNFRDENETVNSRPLFFVVHSMGGIVIQDALVRSRSSPDNHIRQILNCTKGIIFLGTPHSGTEALATWAKGLASLLGFIKQTNPEILDTLRASSELLYRIQNAFHTMTRDRKVKNEDDINIVCFFEELPVQGFNVIVTKSSATLPSYQSTGLHYNHMEMTKFKDAAEPGFLAVTGDLLRWSKRFRNLVQPTVDRRSPIVSRKEPSLGRTQNIPCFPYSRNSDFVGCEDVLHTIATRLPYDTRLALNGIGGVGKTEIATEFCYRYCEEHPDVSIFWIPCDNDTKIDIAFQEVARRLKLPGYEDPKFDQFELVVRHMSGGEAKPWLMVLDNADDIDLMTEGKRALARLLPKFRNGFVILTTRDPYVARAVVGSGRSTIMVNHLCPADAQSLLRSKLSDDAKIDETIELEVLEVLEYLPLCITQAAAYMDQSEISLYQYWLELTESEASLIEILNDDHIEVRRGFDAPNSVLRAWKLSFEKIRRRYQQAGQLLSVMAFLDRQNIPRNLLQSVIASRHQLNSALGTLQGFCLIKGEKGQETFRMHRLIQLATKFWLLNNREDHEAMALKLVSKEFPGPDSEDHDVQRQLLPHAKMVESYTFRDESSNIILADLQYKVAAYEWYAGQYDLAEKSCQAAYEKRQSLLSGLHEDTIHTYSLLGVIRRYQGSWDEAYLIQKEVLRLKESVFGVDHLDTINTLCDLADVREQQGHFAEAEEMAQRAYDIQMKCLGDSHQKTIQSLMNIATYKRRRANYKDAETLGRQALQRYEETLGKNHMMTLTSGKRVVEGRKRIFGDNHPQTLLAINNLALGHRLNGDLEVAEALYRQVCTTNDKLQRVDHPENLQSHQCLAQVLRDLGNYDEAEKVGRDTLARRELVLGKEHLSTMNTAENLALTLDLKGNYKEAESLSKRVLEVRTKGLGESHTYTLDTLFILASIKEYTGRIADAIIDFIRVRDERTRVLGLQHPATQKAIRRLQQLTERQSLATVTDTFTDTQSDPFE